jgi:hypothetical protein
MPALENPSGQRLHIGIDIVRRQTRARYALRAKRMQKGLSAVIAATERHAVTVEVTANVFNGNAFDGERDHARRA